jgi:pimeloyl-ACP methyl ester carboxylesterase
MKGRVIIFAIAVLVPVVHHAPAQKASPTPAQRKAGEVVIEAAALILPGNETINFELGTLYAPENRADPKSRLIGVGFARFKAPRPTGAPPTFHLPGGPGSSYLTGLKPGANQRTRRPTDLEQYRGVSDVVFVDQRGYSEAGDILNFKYRTREHPLDQPISIDRSTAALVEVSRAAVAEFAGKGVDLGGYTVKELADDVNDLRKALGYDRITLIGQSFGSQWSFAVMRRHPDIVARAVLSGVEPLNCGYDMPSHVFAAIQRQWFEAEQDPRFKPYLPPGGLAAAAREVLRRLDQAPVKAPVKNEQTGETATITLGREDFQRNSSMLDGARGPAFLLSLYHGRYDELARSALAQRRSREAEVSLIGPLIDTSLGVTPKREYLLRTDAGTEFMGQWNFNGYLATADIWPTADVGDDFRAEIISNIPVVFVHGNWDTSTPIENLLQVAPFFPNGRTLIVERGRHAAIKQLMSHAPEALTALLEFVQTGNAARLPARVTLPAQKFAAPDFPPPGAKPRS